MRTLPHRLGRGGFVHTNKYFELQQHTCYFVPQSTLIFGLDRLFNIIISPRAKLLTFRITYEQLIVDNFMK